MSLDFPLSPIVDQLFTAPSGVTYRYDGVVWSVDTTDSNDAFITNSSIVSTDFTLGSGRNAMSAGPVEVQDGVTVTIPGNQSWVIV